MNDLTKTMREAFDKLPPMMKYPTMVLMVDTLIAELPEAKKEYDEARLTALKNLNRYHKANG